MKSLLTRWLERSAARHPESPALILDGQVFSYAALCQQAPAGLPERLANLMKQAELPGRAELLISTSGSTGSAKQVMLSEANLQASVAASRSRIPLAPGDVWLNCLPLQHIGGLIIFYRCAEAGATVLLQREFDAAQVLADMARHGVSHISLVPAMLARLLDAGSPPARLKYALIGGGPLSAALARRAQDAGWPVCPSYGMSEAASQVATLAGLPPDWREGMVGQPLPGISVQIVDDNGQVVPGEGRIHVRGPIIMVGYANAAHAPGHGLEQGWFASGDRGYLDERGRLIVLGRHDDMLISGGVCIHPVEVENLLSACPGVSEAAVTALRDETWGDLIAALVVCQDIQAVEGWSRTHLPSALRPRRFFAIDGLPRNALGKLERKRLPALALAMENQPLC